MNKGGVYVKHAVIRPIIAGIFSRKRRYASTSRRSSITRTAVRRLQSSTIAADHPLKLLQPPNPKRNRPQPRERVRNLRTRGMDLETPQSKMVFKFGVQIKTLMEDEPENYQSHFSEYIKRGIEADSLEGMYKKVHAAIRADPTTKKSGKPGKCVHIEFYNSTYVH
ncbi:hypothetical protein V6N13_083369 [Hibiscus sabdariffa]